MSESAELERKRPESIASLLVYVRGGREKGSASRDAGEVVGNQTNHHTPQEVDRMVGGDRGARSGGGVGRVRRYASPTFITAHGYYLMVSQGVGYWEWKVSRRAHRNLGGFKWLAQGVTRTKRDAMRLGTLVLESIDGDERV